MPPKDATSSLVEHLGEAEQALSQSSGPGSQVGSNSLVNSEERDSVVEGAAMMDDLERSSNMDTRSEVGSDGSRFNHRSDAASMADGSRADRMAAIMSDVDDPSQPSLQSLSISTWQRLLESQDAKKEVDAELLFAKEAMEAMRVAHAEEATKMKQQLVHMKIDGAKDLFFGKRELEATVQLLRKQLLTSEQKGENDASEMDIMRLNLASIVAGHTAEMADMKGRLNPAMSGDIYKEFLKKQLADSNHANRAMGAELAALRLKMLDDNKVHQGEVGDLRTLLDAANLKSEMNEYGDSGSSSSSHLLGGKAPGTKKRPKKPSGSKSKLNAIEEEDDDAGSITAESAFSSFNVSSDGGDAVGDMKDFDDDDMYELILRENTKSQNDIASLESAAAVQREIAAELAADVASREVNTEERIQALIEQLALSRSNHAVTKGELFSLRGEARLGEGPEMLRLLNKGRAAAAAAAALEGKQRRAKSEEPDEPEEEEEEKEGRTTATASGSEPPWMRPTPSAASGQGRHVEELMEQLGVLKEANRIAEARIADLKHTVAAEEARHKREKEELTRKLQAGGAEGGDGASELNDLRDLLKSAGEEKNLLLNTLESKELRWKTEMENMQLELEQAERIRDGEASKFESDIALLKATIKDLESSKSVPVPEEAAPPPEAPAAALGWLRCPTRGAGRPAEAEGRRPAYCQETCWAVVSAIPGAVALWCSSPGYAIQHASREASRIWGSSLLHEQSIFSLVGEASVGRWLKKAFESHQRMADMEQGVRCPPGFIVRDLGCEAFASRSGDAFDCAVVSAHFPAEPVCRRPAAVLVILEPQARVGFTPPASQPSGLLGDARSGSSASGGRSGHGASRRRRHPASHGTGSDVSASSVSPSDSASNVLGYG